MESIWSQSCSIRERETLHSNLEVEVAVIGAGSGSVFRPPLPCRKLDARWWSWKPIELAAVKPGNTTAKITSQHGMVYQKLIQTMGMDAARQYAQANQLAVRAYKDIIKAKRIDCDFEERNAYVYGSDAQTLQEQVRAAVELGLPAS